VPSLPERFYTAGYPRFQTGVAASLNLVSLQGRRSGRGRKDQALQVLDVQTGCYQSYSVRGSWSGNWCFGADGRSAVLEMDDARLEALDFASGSLTSLGRGHWPCVSSEGDLAFTTPNRRGIVVARPGRALESFRGPRTDLSFLQWTSDCQGLLYLYRIGPWRHSIWSLVANTWGIGLMDVRTGQHYRVLPGDYSGAHIYGAWWPGRAWCVSGIPPGLWTVRTRGASEPVGDRHRRLASPFCHEGSPGALRLAAASRPSGVVGVLGGCSATK